MKQTLLFFSLLLCVKAYAQPDIKHSIYFKDKKCVYDADPPPNFDLKHWYWNIEAHSSGNFYAIRPLLVGTGANTQYDVLLYKLNAQFDTLWSKQIGGSEDDWIFSIKELPSGNLILSGTTQSNDGDVPYGHLYSAKEIWVMRVDENGNILSGKTFGGSWGSDFRSGIYSSDGYMYMIGETNADDYDFTHVKNSPFDTNVWVSKLDTNLNLKWVRLFNGDSDEGGFSIEEVTPNMFVLCISTAGTNSEMLGNQAKGIADMLVYCIDSNKNTIWAKRLGSSGLNDARKCLVDPIEKNIYVIGLSQYGDLDVQYQTADSSLNIWIVKLDTLGNIVNSKAYGNKQAGYYTESMSIVDAIWHNGHVWVTAYSKGGGADMDPRTGTTSNNNNWIGMIDTQANLVGKYTIGNIGNDTPIDLFTNGNELFLHGWSGSPNNNMSCSGKIIATYILNIGNAPLGIEDVKKEDIILFDVYPNPTNNTLNIKIAENFIHKKGELKITDIKGRIVYKALMPSMQVQKAINCSDWETGNYIVELKCNNHTQTIKITKE